ncbi:unnamed protein product [Protopolystoma xenopodis]|uniref:Uncharacterized protein n=1 Tax=Protopolystoma xenopodis TaxID=117903 RepID=A0A448X365_9PLAT|nr:unnamed protein product [Protopolystoma xenopodis]
MQSLRKRDYPQFLFTTASLSLNVHLTILRICLSSRIPMYDAWITALHDASNDRTVKIVAVTGAGDYFSSGNDLSNFTMTKSPLEMAEEAKSLLLRFVAAFIDFPKPLVALVNGPAVGISVTTLGLYDYIFAADNATFHTPFTSLGQTPEGCSSYTFPKVMGQIKVSYNFILPMAFLKILLV